MMTPHRAWLNRQLLDLAAMGPIESLLEVGTAPRDYAHIFRARRYIKFDIKPPKAGVQADLLALPFRRASFDLVLCLNVLEHVYDLQTAMAEMHSVLKPGGKLIAYTPFLFPLHDIPEDYWRPTEWALRRLAAAFNRVEIITHRALHRRLPLGHLLVAEKSL
jgi:SAM-dependent methyltransferase